MNNDLTPQLRPDRNGKMVTRWVKDNNQASSGSLPTPKLDAGKQASRTAKAGPVKLTEKQSKQATHYVMQQDDIHGEGGHGINSPLSEELAAIPFTEQQRERANGGWYRFVCTEAEFYSVLSVARPLDALNLMHRGIRSAEEATDFLTEHGIDYLAGDYTALTQELLRHRVPPNFAASHMDEAIDFGAELEAGADWIKLCSYSSIRDDAKVIAGYMLSGMVTFDDMRTIGIKNLNYATMPWLAKAVANSKSDGNPDFTVHDIHRIAEDYIENVHTSAAGFRSSFSELPAMLDVGRFHGSDVVHQNLFGIDSAFHRRLKNAMKDSGEDERRLADLTLYITQVRNSTMVSGSAHDAEYIALFDAGIPAERVANYLEGAFEGDKETSRRISALLEGVVPAISDGWI